MHPAAWVTAEEEEILFEFHKLLDSALSVKRKLQFLRPPAGRRCNLREDGGPSGGEDEEMAFPRQAPVT